MQQNFTRAARRKLRAQSKAAAPLLARTFFDRDPTTGKATLVTDPRAVHVLERVCRRPMLASKLIRFGTRAHARESNTHGIFGT